MSSWLLDVNVILASRWSTHADHIAVKRWLESVDSFYTCAITEIGFIRISLSNAYRASWDETLQTLRKLHARRAFQFLVDDLDGTATPRTDSKDVTDAHLVALAKRHDLKVATLDEALLRKPWAADIAANPLVLTK